MMRNAKMGLYMARQFIKCHTWISPSLCRAPSEKWQVHSSWKYSNSGYGWIGGIFSGLEAGTNR